MAKAKGPLFSMEARGKFGNSLIFQNQNGVNVVKNFAKPRNPNSAAQQISRANFQAVAAVWKDLTGGWLSSWDAAVNEKYLTPKAAFFGINLDRLARGRFIAYYYPLLPCPETADLTVEAYIEVATVNPSGTYRRTGYYDGNHVYERLGDCGFVLWREVLMARWILSEANPGTILNPWVRESSMYMGSYDYISPENPDYCSVYPIE